MEHKIIKVKFERKTSNVTIEYEDVFNAKNDEIKIVLKSTDTPRRELIALLDELRGSVEEICLLPDGYCATAEIRGVSFSWTNDIMGAVITALVPIKTANSPVVINTPHLPSESYNDSNEAPVLPNQCVWILKVLVSECRRYIDGDREKSPQMEMELEVTGNGQ